MRSFSRSYAHFSLIVRSNSHKFTLPCIASIFLASLPVKRALSRAYVDLKSREKNSNHLKKDKKLKVNKAIEISARVIHHQKTLE